MPKEYDPENEVDPEQIARDHLALGKKILDRMEKADAEEERRKLEYAEAVRPVAGSVMVYKPPPLEEVSASLKKAWDEVEKIMPTAPDAVKTLAYQTLLYSTAPHPGPFGVA